MRSEVSQCIAESCNIRKGDSMLYIGIDLGTSAVKLLLMDADGKIKKIVSRTYDLSFPHPGWSEQNPATGMNSRSMV